MKRSQREDLPDGGHTEAVWDDETGDADLTRYDASGAFVERFQTHDVNPDAEDGELSHRYVELDAEGNEIARRDVIQGEGPDPTEGGWS